MKVNEWVRPSLSHARTQPRRACRGLAVIVWPQLRCVRNKRGCLTAKQPLTGFYMLRAKEHPSRPIYAIEDLAFIVGRRAVSIGLKGREGFTCKACARK